MPILLGRVTAPIRNVVMPRSYRIGIVQDVNKLGEPGIVWLLFPGYLYGRPVPDGNAQWILDYDGIVYDKTISKEKNVSKLIGLIKYAEYAKKSSVGGQNPPSYFPLVSQAQITSYVQAHGGTINEIIYIPNVEIYPMVTPTVEASVQYVRD